jgi:two-component system, NarL family, nitrate/nitrite response regulator NarL
MALRITAEAKVAESCANVIVPRAEEILRKLIVALHHEGNPSPQPVRRSAEATEAVLCSTEVEGVQYYLVRSQPHDEGGPLSPRELAIARLIAQGMPNKCIGEILEISPWTVATHLRRMFAKLGVNSRAALIARLSANGVQVAELE